MAKTAYCKNKKNCILHGGKSKGKQNMSIFQNGLINSQFAKKAPYGCYKTNY